MLYSPYGKHACLVFEPLREPLWLLNERFEENVIPSNILKIMVQMLLHGLDYLHTECRVIHTGKHSPYFVRKPIQIRQKETCLMASQILRLITSW